MPTAMWPSALAFDHYKVLFRIAQCHQEYGRQIRSEDPARADAEIAEALKSYDQLLTQHEDSPLIPDVLFNAGFANQIIKKNEAAQPLYQRLVDEYADHPAAPNGLLQLARIAYAASDLKRAEEIYTSFLDRFPDSELRNTTRMELGLTYKRLQDQDSAIAAYEMVEADWDKWPTVQVELAEFYMGKQEYEKARKALSRALDRADDDTLRGQMHYTLARGAFRRGQFRGCD